MSDNIKKIKYRKQHGMVFITALVSMVVMFLLCMVLMQLGRQQLLNATNDMKAVYATAAADAGTEYAIWNQKYPDESHAKIDDQVLVQHPFPQDKSFGLISNDYRFADSMLTPPDLGSDNKASTAVWLFKDGGRYVVISRGTYRENFNQPYQRWICTTLRGPTIMPPVEPPKPPLPAVLNHALFSGTTLTIGGTSTVIGDVGSNGDIIMSGTAKVTGDASAAGVISGKTTSITGELLTHQPQVVLSDIINLTYLMQYAAQNGGVVYDGDKTFFADETISGKVIYVKGDITINADTVFSGLVTLVAEGNVTINGNCSSVGPTDSTNLTIISPNAINVKVNGAASIYATIIAPGVDAEFSGVGTASIIGGVIANSVTSNGTFDITYLKPNDNGIIVEPPPVDTNDPNIWTSMGWQQL